jgi:hypothetical protein
MANLGFTADVDDLPQDNDGNFTPLPAGWYSASINDAQLKDTKKGDGKYIAIRFDITGPSHEGRVVFSNLNIQNKSPKAEEIGRSQLGQIMRAMGLKKVDDSDELIGGQVMIKLTVTKSEQYGDGNDVKSYKAIEGASMPSAPAANADDAPPWMK